MFRRTAATAAMCFAATTATAAARGAVVFSDDFSGAFPGPWTNVNASTPGGDRPAGWYHGAINTTLAAPGPPAAAQQFAASTYESAGPGPGAVSSAWLISPALTFGDGYKLSLDVCGMVDSDYADRLQVRLNAHDGGANVGASPTSVGSFDKLLLDINANYATYPDPAGVPTTWARYTITLSGLGGTTTGRFGIRYFVEDSGPDGSRGNELGIDNVTLEAPEPSAAAAAGVAAAAGLLRRRRRVR